MWGQKIKISETEQQIESKGKDEEIEEEEEEEIKLPFENPFAKFSKEEQKKMIYQLWLSSLQDYSYDELVFIQGQLTWHIIEAHHYTSGIVGDLGERLSALEEKVGIEKDEEEG